MMAMFKLPAIFVAKEGGSYKVLATSGNPAALGHKALNRRKAGDEAGARRWLDLAVFGQVTTDATAPRLVVIPPSGPGSDGKEAPAAQLLWSGFNELKRGAALIRMVAASMIATDSVSQVAILLLKQARPLATNGLDRGNLELALCQAYAKAQRWSDLLVSAKALSASFSVADKSFHYLSKARMGLKQWTELEQDAATVLKETPGDAEALRVAAEAMLRAGELERAGEYIERIRKLPFRSVEEYLLQARYELLTENTSEATIAELEKQSRPEQGKPGDRARVGSSSSDSGRGRRGAAVAGERAGTGAVGRVGRAPLIPAGKNPAVVKGYGRRGVGPGGGPKAGAQRRGLRMGVVAGAGKAAGLMGRGHRLSGPWGRGGARYWGSNSTPETRWGRGRGAAGDGG